MQNISYGEFNKINSINFTSEYGKLKNIKLEGSTSQSTRSGKNLLNVTAKTTTTQGLTFTVNEDKSITINGTNTGTGTYYFRIANNFALPAGDYTLSNKNPSVNNNSGFIFYDDENNFPRTNISNATFTKDTTIKPYLKVNAGVTVNNQTVYPMIIKGTYTEETLPPYEQYGASPSPDYPSGIENVEGKNKFNNNFSDYSKPVDYYICPIHVKNETSYKFNINLIRTKMTGCVIGIVKDGNQYSNFVGLSQALNTAGIVNNLSFKVDNTWVSPKLIIFAPNGETQFKQIFENYEVQLEEGTVATDYVPYNSLEIKDIGTNLLKNSSLTENLEDWDVVRTDNTTLSISEIFNKKCLHIKGGLNKGQYIRQSIQNRIQAGNKYTISCKAYLKDFVSGTTNPICAFYLDGVGIDGKWIGPSYSGGQNFSDTKYNYSQGFVEVKTTITINKNTDLTKAFAMFVYARDFTGDLYIYDLQLEEGTIAKPYVPYQEQKVTFPLSEGQKLYEGSYLASDGIHHKRKQVVLDGSEDEDWTSYSTKNGLAYKIPILNIKQIISTVIIADLYCDYYTKTSQDKIYDEKIDYGICQRANQSQIIIRNKDILTLAEWKAWLSEHPITVEYELATEEIVPYTTEQQEAGDKIENFPIFIGQNNLTSTALLSAIYIKKITTDTKVDYNLYNEDYIKIATKNNIHPKFKIQMLDEYENVIDEITGDISRDNSGSISNNYQQGVRRSVSLTFIDTEGKFLPDSNSNLIWANKKFKLFSGLLDTDTNEIFWFSEGIYYFSNVSSSRNGADKLTTVNGVDKFGKFGSELGYNQLESTYLIPAGTKIYDAIKGILNIDIGNGYPIDPIEPVLDPLYIDEVCPYDISKSPSSYLSEMLIELADIIGCDIYYDADGRLHVDSGTIDFSYSNKPSIWDFSDVLPEYMNPSITTNFAEFINTVKVVGNNTNDKTYEYTAVNNNPESPTRVDLIGTKSTYIESASVYNTDRAKDYAEYKLNMFSILQLAVTFSCTFLPHLDVNKVITITDSYYKYEKQRFVIQSITLPLSYDGVMSISACNVASLPYYEGGN